MLSSAAAAALLGGGAAVALANDSVDTSANVRAGARVQVGNQVRVHLNADATEQEDTDTEDGTTTRARSRGDARAEAEDRLTDRMKERAHMEIERRMELLNHLSDRIEGALRISGDDKSSLSSLIQAQIDMLVALKAKIESNTSTTSLRDDIKSINDSHRAFAFVAPKAAITAYADRLKTLVAQMTTLGAKLQARIDAASSAGTDVSAAVTAMADYNAKITDAQAQITAAADEVSALQADNGDATVAAANKAALKDARAKLDLARKDLETARKDVHAILKALPKVEASSQADASAETN